MSDNWEDDDYEIPVLNVPLLERLERLAGLGIGLVGSVELGTELVGFLLL
jgi:hypothetical protein